MLVRHDYLLQLFVEQRFQSVQISMGDFHVVERGQEDLLQLLQVTSLQFAQLNTRLDDRVGLREVEAGWIARFDALVQLFPVDRVNDGHGMIQHGANTFDVRT